jgi:hypothetical protein
MFDFGAPSAPVANWGVLGFPEASTIYNFIYSWFPPMAVLRRWCRKVLGPDWESKRKSRRRPDGSRLGKTT